MSEDTKSMQKSLRSLENGDVEEGFEFLEQERDKEEVFSWHFLDTFFFLTLSFFSDLFILDKEEAVVSPVVNQVADDDDRQPIPEGKVTKRKSIVVSTTRTITELALAYIDENFAWIEYVCFLILPKFSLFVGLLFHGTQTSFSTSLLQLHQSSGKENCISISVMHVKYVFFVSSNTQDGLVFGRV